MAITTFLTYLTTAIVVSISLLLVYAKWSQTYWKRKKIAHLEPSFIFGNFGNPLTSTDKSYANYFRTFYNRLKQMGLKYGGIYCYTRPAFLLVDPDSIKHVLVKSFYEFHDRGFYTNERDQPVSVNLVTTKGEKWRNLRVKFTPTFTTAKMKTMFHLMVNAAKSMEEYVAEQTAKKIPLNATDCVCRFSTDIIGTCAFGLDYNSFKEDSFHKTTTRLMELTTKFFRFSFCLAFPKVARFFKLGMFPKKEADTICESIEETVRHRLSNPTSRNDFLKIVLELKESSVITMTELLAQSLLFFVAGQATVSFILVFILFELALNEDVQQRLRSEVNETLSKHDEEMNYEAIMNMKYLDMVMCESLRKYPPVPILNRKCITDVTLPDSGITIEEGTDVLVPVYGLHHDPAYFPDPDKFDPERFSDENKHNIIPFTYLPFGEGPRNCIGDRFAKQEMKIGIARLIRRFRFKVNPMVKLPIQFAANISLKPTQDILLDVEEI